MNKIQKFVWMNYCIQTNYAANSLSALFFHATKTCMHFCSIFWVLNEKKADKAKKTPKHRYDKLNFDKYYSKLNILNFEYMFLPPKMLLTEVFLGECSNLCSEMCLIMHIENVTKQ